MMSRLERERLKKLKADYREMKESHRFLRTLLACVCLKYGNLTLDTAFYRIPKEPEFFFDGDGTGYVTVRLRAIEALDPAKHKES